jgi:hypothetical protein
MSLIREQIAAKRAYARSQPGTPVRTPAKGPAARDVFGSPGFGTPSRRGPAVDELLEETTVPGQIGKARRSGEYSRV